MDKQSEIQKYLKIKMILYPILLILIPATIITIIPMSVNRKVLTEKVEDINEQLISQLQFDIDQQVNNLERGLASLVANRKIKNIIQKDYTKNVKGKVDDFDFVLSNIRNIINAHHEFISSIAIYSLNNKNYFEPGEMLYEDDFINSSWYKEAILKKGELNFGLPVKIRFEIGGLHEFIPVVRVYEDTIIKKDIFTIKAFVNPDIIDKILIKALYGSGSEVILINSNGDIIRRVNYDSKKSSFFSTKEVNMFFYNMNNSSRNSFILQGEEDQLITFKKSKVNDWVMVSSIPMKNLLKELNDTSFFILTVIFIAVFITILISGVFFNKSVVTPINRILKMAFEISDTKEKEGELEEPAIFNSIKVIGKTEWQIIDSLLEQMVLELKKKYFELESSNKKILEAHNSLENKVNERTAELKKVIITLKSTQSQLIASAKLAAVGDVASAMAHEINSPLGAIYNCIELVKLDLELLDENETKESLLESIEIMEEASKKSKLILSKLLDKVDGIESEKTYIDLSEVVKNNFLYLEMEMPLNQFILKMDIEENVLLLGKLSGIEKVMKHVVFYIKEIFLKEENLNRELLVNLKRDTKKIDITIFLKENSPKNSKIEFRESYSSNLVDKNEFDFGIFTTKDILNSHNADIKIDDFDDGICITISFKIS